MSDIQLLMKRTVLILGVLIVVGCTLNKEKYTSGLVGCPEEQITIVSESGGMMANTWTAKCAGKTFYCTYQTGGVVYCKESILKAEQ